MMPLQFLFVCQDQFGYGRRRKPPSPFSLLIVMTLTGTPFCLIAVTNILPSMKILLERFIHISIFHNFFAIITLFITFKNHNMYKNVNDV